MKKIAVVLVATLLAVVTAVASDQPPAEADVNCVASNEATLGGCIAAANAETEASTIRLSADIVLSADLPAINSTGFLFLLGNGYTIDADGAATNVLTFSGGVPVVDSIGLTGAIEHGISATGGTGLVVSGSTIHANGGDGINSTTTASIRISNSTIADNDNDGIEAGGSGDVTITSTTVVDNDWGLWDPSGLGGGRWTVTDSVVAGNTVDDCAVSPGLSLGDATDSLFGDGTCTGTATAGLAASLGSLADNGCTGFSICLPTIAIGPSSPALDAAGTCGNVSDQRGFPRTAGLCDAGAFEAGDCPSVQHSVTDGTELAFAIECFNAQRPAGDHEITLEFSIGISEELPTISSPNNQLTILGDETFISPEAPLPTDAVLFVIGAGTLAVDNVFIDDHGTTTFDRAFEVTGGALELTNSTVERVGQAVFVAGGLAEIRNSDFSQMSVGVQVENGGRAVISESSIENTDSGVWVEGTGTAVVYNTTVIYGGDVGIGADGASASAIVSLSTLFRNGVGLISENGASVVARGVVVAESDTASCEGTMTNDSFNYADDGTCTGFNPLTGPIGVNQTGQCTVPTPLDSCVRIVPLEPGSNAVNGGVCSLITTFVGSDDSLELRTITNDVRGTGFPRPVGSTCDAGSFELQSLPVCDGKPVTIYWGPGATATAGDDVIWGTSGDDEIDALGGNDTVCAGDGNDVIIGGDGNDRLFGENGRDIARGNTGEDYIDGGPGNDRLLGGIGDDELIGRDGDDYLGGFGGDDLISGGPGDETIYGGYGADRIAGDAGNDTIRGLIGNDSIDGGPGNDVLDGDRGSDSIVGGTGADVINGGNAGDVLYGEGGNDTVNGGRADDVLSGGFGTDVCSGNLHFAGDTTDGSCETVFGVP